MINLNRFRDTVALDVGDSSTIHIIPEIARELGEKLVAYANDVELYGYLSSQLTSVSCDLYRIDLGRFRDAVTLAIGDGATTYLTQAIARELGEKLGVYVEDIAACDFVSSRLGSLSWDEGRPGAALKHKIQREPAPMQAVSQP